jgi:hypothetical protein
MKKLIPLLLLTTPCLGQRYEGWTENPNGSTSYTHGRFVQYRTIDDELQESYQAMMDYLKDSQLQRDQEKVEAMAKRQLEEIKKQTALLEEIANK